ncbi:hypothetical protein JOM56_006398, partial [Amanita muscaria]
KEHSKAINPGSGCLWKGGILSGADGTSNTVLVDVNPLTLGIKTFTRLTPRNTIIPTCTCQMCVAHTPRNPK